MLSESRALGNIASHTPTAAVRFLNAKSWVKYLSRGKLRGKPKPGREYLLSAEGGLELDI